MEPKARLTAHLESWLGAWPPPRPGINVVGSHRRVERGWDGLVRPLAGVSTPEGTVLSVAPAISNQVSDAIGDATDLMGLGPVIAGLVGVPNGRVGSGIFRWSTDPTPLADAGTWVERDAPGVPPWLFPFNGQVLVAWDDEGAYAAGVGRKVHDQWGHELAVGTDEAHRGRGLGRRLVAQAARRVLADGAVPTYLHDPANTASAHVADAAGFPDRGWRIVGLWSENP